MVRKRIVILGIVIVISEIFVFSHGKVLSKELNIISMSSADEYRWIYKREDNKPSTESFVIDEEMQIKDRSSGISQSVYVEDNSNSSSKQINTNLSTNQYVGSVPRPEWFEFCPIEYENPKCYKVPFTNAQFDSNDWCKLKRKFEELRADCDSRDGMYKDICYDKLRHDWKYKTTHFTSTVEKFQQWSNNYQRMQMQEKFIDAINRPVQVNVNGNLYHPFR